jgi:RNA polymerase sigma factor (sigma-70 family)
MAQAKSDTILRHLRDLTGLERWRGLSDAQLLRRFVGQRDETAFAALVGRHGPLVWGVCRQLLGHDQDAEDAFQAAFLALARKAGGLRRGEAVAGWLYRVAGRIARRAVMERTRRRQHERQAGVVRHGGRVGEGGWQEIQTVLQEELDRLPEKYRAAFVVCCLEGKSRAEAAVQLGLKEGTLSSRLAHARQVLQARLVRRGIELPAVLAAAALVIAETRVPAAVVYATSKAAALFAAGASGVKGYVSAQAAAFAEEVVQAMTVTKLKLGAVLVLLASALVGGVGLAAYQAQPESPSISQGPESQGPATGDGDQSKAAGLARPRTDMHGDPVPEGVVTRLGTMRFRHVEAVALAFAADGKALLTCGRTERIIRFWDPVTGRLLREQPFPLGYPLALSPDGRLLVFQNADEGTITLWETARSQCLHKLPLAEQRYLQVFFSPDSKTLVTAQFDGTLRAWDVATGQGRLVGKHEEQPWSLCFAADGTLLSTSPDPDPKGRGRILHLWDLAGGRERARLSLAGVIDEVVLSPDGRTVAAWYGHGGDFDKGVQFWDVATGKPAQGWIAPALTRVHSVQFAPDGKTVAISTAEGALIWDPAVGRSVHTFRGGYGCKLTYSPDGRTLAALRNWRYWTPWTTAVLVWDATTGAARVGAEQGHLDEVEGVALSPDGRLVASISHKPYSGNGTVCLWDAATGRLLRSLPADRMTFRPLAFSPDGKHLFLATPFAILRFDVATGRETGRYAVEGKDRLLFSHLADDGRTLRGAHVAWSGGRAGPGAAPGLALPGGKGGGGPPRVTLALYAWDVATGNRLLAPTFTVAGQGTDGAGYSRFSPDGRLLGIPGGILCDTATGRELGRVAIDGRGFGLASAFSPDGALVAGAEDHWHEREKKKAVHVWEVATLLPVARLETGGVAHLAFTPDGRRLIAAGLEALQLWDLVSEQQVASRPAHDRFRGHFGPSFVSSFALGADGRTVATGHRDTTVLLWDLAAPFPSATPLSPAELEACWADLAGADGRRALIAVSRLRDVPDQAMRLLRGRLRPAAAIPEEELRRAVAELDGNAFTRREAATKRLAAWGELAEPALKEALRGQPSPEARRRIEDLLAAPRLVREPEARRALRAVRVLEGTGTPGARQVLEPLAQGAPEARLTIEACAALRRLGRRP